MKSYADRRQFLSAALVGLWPKSERKIEGRIVDDSHLLGHKLRDGRLRASPKEDVRVPLVIVGGGIAGLSAAWRLQKRGFTGYLLLEMEKQPGGNSRWGENEICEYPWAAHYLPVPNRDSTLVRELCEEFGLREDGEWSERHLCFTPQERLFLHGRWQEGLEPDIGLTRNDRQQFRRFEASMREFAASGHFTIPAGDRGGLPELDGVSMASWLDSQKLDSPYLRWYVDYACRDDYGALASETSAWAGIHYFASRQHEARGPFVWPEGNGWLVKRLLERVGARVRPSSMVLSLRRANRRVEVLTEKTRYIAQAVIWAAPTFLLPYVFEDAPPAKGMIYSPWVTANLTLDRMPEEKHAPLAWDNVIYGSQSLGYVDAMHQSLRSFADRSVWTWYMALAEGSPADNRRMLLEKDWAYWKERILRDIERAHPDIRHCVRRIDVMRLGHAMARPVPGWMRSQERLHLARWGADIVLANSDLSGLSIFEEAQYRGVEAADRALRRVT